MDVMKSFQEFVDEVGITRRFRMSSRNLSRLADLYDVWRTEAPPSAWECGYVVGWQRVREGVLHMTLSSGAVIEVRLR
jgi:hypothetical protein